MKIFTARVNMNKKIEEFLLQFTKESANQISADGFIKRV